MSANSHVKAGKNPRLDSDLWRMVVVADRPCVRKSDILVRTILTDGGLNAVLPVIIHDLPEPAIPHLDLEIGWDELLEIDQEALVEEHGATEVT